MIALDTNATKELGALNDALMRVAAIGRRSPAELIRRAAADIMLGSTGSGKGSGAYDGLYGALLTVAPKEGEISNDAFVRGYEVKAGSSMLRGEEKATAILGADRSGVFSVQRNSNGRVYTPKRVYVRTRGKSAGQVYSQSSGRKLAKSAVAAPTTDREMLRGRGYSVLNRRALAVAIAINYRESARRATAVQFLAKRYRRILVRKAGYDYTKGGMAKGVSSVDLAMTHDHRRVVVQNKKGTQIGSVELMLKDSDASAHIVGFFGIPPQHMGILSRVLGSVRADREAYLIHRAMKETLKK